MGFGGPWHTGEYHDSKGVWDRHIADFLLMAWGMTHTIVILAGASCSTEELIRLVYDTMRERYRAVPIPDSVSKLLAQPREFLRRYVSLCQYFCFPSQNRTPNRAFSAEVLMEQC